MIYILGRRWLGENDELEEVIEIASIDIQDILDYLNLEYMKYYQMTDMTIVIKPNAIHEHFVLDVNKDMIVSLEKYPSPMLLDNKTEYEDMKKKVSEWCSKINKEIEIQKKLEQEEQKAREEAKERRMYEKLKAKYGNE